MKFTKPTIEKLFQKWGTHTTKLSAQNDAIKSTVLGEVKPNETKHTYPNFRIPWFALAGVGAVILVVIINNDTPKYSTMPLASAPMAPSYEDDAYGLSDMGSIAAGLEKKQLNATAESAKISMPESQMMPPLYYPSPETPITDRREYLKTNYSAAIKTRHVEKIGTQITTTVRGYGGRIDSISVSERYGYIQFVIPKSSLESFKLGLHQLVPARFLIENMGQQNLLPEKIMIEDNRAATKTTLTTLQNDRTALIKAHTTTVASIQQQITNAKKSLTALEAELKQFPERKDEITKKQTELQNEMRRLQSRLYEENNKFNANLKQADSNISYHESLLTSLDKQDQTLVDNVETVQGSIMIEWISIPALTKLYLADYWYLLLLLIPVLVFFRARPQVLDLP